jgi:putative nucleotidyltransferase with HDIG domain
MGAAGQFGSMRHLAERFFGALSPAGPPPEEESWARQQMLPGELLLWERMSGPDRRHAVGVAHDALALLDDGGDPPGRDVAAGALLHDVGKVESGLGTFSRVWVTLAAIGVGRERLAGLQGGGVRARVRLYLTHDRVGADLLRAAGSDSLTVAWAEEHHLDQARWTVPARLGLALKAADGD